jgi:hypothetical protein
MRKWKRFADYQIGEPSNTNHSLPRSFASLADLKQAILNASRIEDHAERAGFRRGRGGKWHCGLHADSNPSCSIRDGRIRCWTCGESWNVIDLEMVATGNPFLRCLRALAYEYGIPVQCRDINSSAAATLEWRKAQECAFHWREAFLELAEEILEDEKAKLFNPTGSTANEALIFALTGMELRIRGASGVFDLVSIFETFNKLMPSLTDALVEFGEERRHARQSMLASFIDLAGRSENRW